MRLGLLPFALLTGLSACGGNVVVDATATGAGGASSAATSSGAGGASTTGAGVAGGSGGSSPAGSPALAFRGTSLPTVPPWPPWWPGGDPVGSWGPGGPTLEPDELYVFLGASAGASVGTCQAPATCSTQPQWFFNIPLSLQAPGSTLDLSEQATQAGVAPGSAQGCPNGQSLFAQGTVEIVAIDVTGLSLSVSGSSVYQVVGQPGVPTEVDGLYAASICP